jgi:hypothetical protein
MKGCSTCGGAVFATNEVSGYGGAICSGHTTVTLITPSPVYTKPTQPTNSIDSELENHIFDCIRYNKFNLSDTDTVKSIMEKVTAKYISKDKLLKTRPARKSVKPSLTKMSLEDRFADLRHEGYNQALKDWSKALGMEEQND